MEGAVWLANLIAHEALLFAAVGFLIGGIDDLAVDLIWIARHVTRRATVYRRHARATLADFPLPARRFAMFVPAWDEGAVAGRMLRTMLARIDCPQLSVFIGCYANDQPTLNAVAEVTAGDARAVLVVNPRGIM